MRRKSRNISPFKKSKTHWEHPFSSQAVFSQDRIADIHDLALKTLSELGMKILDPEARDILLQNGAIVQEDMVFIGRDMIESALKSAPKSIKLNGQTPDHNLDLALGQFTFTCGSGCPNVSDLINGWRTGDLNAYENSLRLQQHFDAFHLLGPAIEPQDVPPHLRHYEFTRAQLALADKIPVVNGRGRAQVEQCFDMLRLGLGVDDSTFSATPHCWTVVNTNSPRLLDAPMAQAVIDFARAGQLVVITPFCLAGPWPRSL